MVKTLCTSVFLLYLFSVPIHGRLPKSRDMHHLIIVISLRLGTEPYNPLGSSLLDRAPSEANRKFVYLRTTWFGLQCSLKEITKRIMA